MKLTGRDLAKAIGFLGVVALVAVSMIIAGAGKPTRAAPSQARIVSGKPNATPAPAEAASALPREHATNARDKAEVQEKVTAAPPRAAASSAQEAPGSKRPAAPAAAYSRGPLPPFPAGPPPFGGQAIPGSPGASWGGPAPSVLWLAGVVEGDPKLAVLRRGDSRYLVKEGDSVEGAYRVVKIASNAVTLQRGRRSLTLRLGRS